MPFLKERLMKLAGLLDEAMQGGTSNAFRHPGHMGKKNELEESQLNEEPLEETLDALDAGKLYKVDMYDARTDLASLTYDVAAEIQNMHVPHAPDRRTEKMTKQKMANMYRLLKKLRNLSK
jgi:hypothetical protein